MTVNHGTNERGRTIVYQVFRDKASPAQTPMFTFAAGRYSEKRVRKECESRDVTGQVVVSWWTSNLWGMDKKRRVVVL